MSGNSFPVGTNHIPNDLGARSRQQRLPDPFGYILLERLRKCLPTAKVDAASWEGTSKRRRGRRRTWGPVKILGTSVEPGQKQRLMVSIVKLSMEESVDKRQLELPAFVARRVRRGHTLGVTGGIHGDELNGVEVARRVALSAQPDKMAGHSSFCPYQRPRDSEHEPLPSRPPGSQPQLIREAPGEVLPRFSRTRSFGASSSAVTGSSIFIRPRTIGSISPKSGRT